MMITSAPGLAALALGLPT